MSTADRGTDGRSSDHRTIAPYEPERDLAAVQRIWTEVGWVSSDEGRGALEGFLSAGASEVGLLDGEAECAVHRTPGVIRYQDVDLPLCAITAVTTSRIARRQGLATEMTARALAAGAAEGAAVAALGIFDQGFYDRLGFGTAGYQTFVSFDPANLRVDAPYRRPVRLGPDDAAEIHRALCARSRRHGGVVLHPPEVHAAELAWYEEPFGLGYRTDGELTHFVYGSAKGESGPYRIEQIAYRTGDQLLDLLRLIAELGDQVTTVTMFEPAEIQLLDLISTPHRTATVRRRSDHEVGARAVAWWQLRLLDVPAAVAARSWSGPPVEFNLRLRDPLADLPRSESGNSGNGGNSGDGGGWRGVGGDYSIRIADESVAEPGHRAGLPVVDASIGAFSRCWFSVRPASSIAITDDLVAPDDLLAALDVALCQSPPQTGLMF